MSQFPPGLNYQTPQPKQPGDDGTLSGLDWVLIVLCSGIACIVGIVRIVQGKPSGVKMLIWSIVFIVIWNVVRFGAMAAMHR